MNRSELCDSIMAAIVLILAALACTLLVVWLGGCTASTGLHDLPGGDYLVVPAGSWIIAAEGFQNRYYSPTTCPKGRPHGVFNPQRMSVLVPLAWWVRHDEPGRCPTTQEDRE